MADETARRLIARIERQGVLRADIAAVLGRDSGLVSQVALGRRGAGYGRGMVPELRELTARLSGLSGADARERAGQLAVGGTLQPKRRAARAGGESRVRQGVKRAGARDAARPGAYLTGRRSATGAQLGKLIDRAAGTGQEVAVRVRVTDARSKSGTRSVFLGIRSAREWQQVLGTEAWRAMREQLDEGDGDAEGDEDEGGDEAASIAEALEALMVDMAANGELGSEAGDYAGFEASVIAA